MIKAKGLKQEYVAPVQPWLATALRTELASCPPWSPRHRQLARRARRAAVRARRIARSYPNNRPHALRESALLAAMTGRPRRARRLFADSLHAAERQGARHEHAQTVLARGLTGLDLGWADASSEVAQGRQALAQLAARSGPQPAEDPEVTLSLLDRFDSLLSVGQQIASALTPDAVHTAVRDAALTLLRAEDCAVIGLGTGDPPATTVLAGRTSQPLPADLVARALVTGRPVVLETPDGENPTGDGPLGVVRARVQPGSRRRLLLPHPRPGRRPLRRRGDPAGGVHRHPGRHRPRERRGLRRGPGAEPVVGTPGGGADHRAGRHQPPAHRAVRGRRAPEDHRRGHQRGVPRWRRPSRSRSTRSAGTPVGPSATCVACPRISPAPTLRPRSGTSTTPTATPPSGG